MDLHGTQYARAGELSIAYAVGGDGPVDILLCPNWTTHVEAWLDLPPAARFVHRLESFARVIRFDLLGLGMSDPVALDEFPTLEECRDYVRVVMDTAGSRRAVLFAHASAAAVAIPFVATYPDRAAGLVLNDASARLYRAEDYPFGFPQRLLDSGLAWWLERWGTGRQLELTAPALAGDPYELEALGRFERYAASPGVARAFFRLIAEYDVREILPAVRTPTLVLHRGGDRYIRVDHGRATSQRGFPAPASSSCRARTTSPSTATWKRLWRRSARSSRPCRSRARPTGCSRRYSSPTSSVRRTWPPSWATGAGVSCSTATMKLFGRSSSASAAS